MKKETNRTDDELIKQELDELIKFLNRNGLVAGTGDQMEELRNAKRKTDRPTR